LNLTIERATALPALQRVAGIVDRKHKIDILSNVALLADGAGFYVRGSDLDMEIVECIPAQISGEGSTTLPLDKLFDIVRNADAGAQVAMAENDTGTRVQVTSGRSRFNVPTLPFADFPEFKHEGFDGEFSMPAKLLADMVTRVSYICDRRPDSWLSCVYLAPFGDLLHAVGGSNDGIALRRETKPKGADLRALLPQKLVNQIGKWLGDADGDVKVSWVGYGSDRCDKMIRLEHGGTILSASLYDHQRYADYMAMLVEEQEVSAKTDQDALTSALRRAQIMQPPNVTTMRAKFGEGALTIRARGDNTGEGEDEIGADYDGPECEFFFNPAKLGETISSLRGDQIEIGFATETDEQSQASAKLVVRAPADPNFTAMLMKARA
jgi:DNA polymerase-3 subunit beta